MTITIFVAYDLFVSVETFQIQFALKVLKMRIKISLLAIVITECDAIGEYNYGVVILHLPFVFAFLCWISII